MRRLRIAGRLIALIGWLLLCIPAYILSRLVTRRRIVPRIFLGGVARMMGVRIATTGELEPRAILLANHLSWLDIPIIAACTGSAFVGHDGIAQSKFLKWLAEMNDTVFIARTRRQTVTRQIEQVREALDNSHVVTLFPEGTTSDGKDLLPLKSSLLSAIDPAPEGVAVQPVFLDFGTAAQEIAWVGDEPGLDNFFKVLGRHGPLDITVHFLPPLTGESLAGRKTIAAATRRALERAVGQ